MDSLPCTVEIKDFPDLHVAAITHRGPYNRIGSAFERLFAWAGPLGLFAVPDVLTLAVYNDSPDVTDPEQLRSSACITVPLGTPVPEGIQLTTLPGGLFAVGRFTIAHTQFGQAWESFMAAVCGSGCLPDVRPCYEVYLNDPETDPEGRFIVELCQPVRRAG